MATYLAAIEELLLENLSPGYQDLLPEVDTFVGQIIRTAEGVSPDPIGVGYLVRHELKLSMGGVLRPAVVGEDTNEVDIGATFRTVEGASSYPVQKDFILPGHAQISFGIARMSGIIPFHKEQLQINRLDSQKGIDYIQMTLESQSQLLAHMDALSFFLGDRAMMAKLTLESADTAVATGNKVLVTSNAGDSLFPTDAMRRIVPGMQVNIYSAADDYVTNYTANGWAAIDTNMNYYSPTTLQLYFQSNTDALAFVTAAHATGADFYLTPYGSLNPGTPSSSGAGLYSHWPCGILSWLRASGYLFGSTFSSIDVTTYGSAMMSLIDAINSNITPSVINKNMAAFERATQLRLDTFLTTEGVLVDIADRYSAAAPAATNPFMIREDPSTLVLGKPPVSYRYNNRMLDVFTSDFLTPGDMLLFKRGDGNLVRYLPPTLEDTFGATPKGMTAPPNIAPRIEWVGKLTGDTIWLPTYNGDGAPTGGMQAPYDVMMQTGAKDPRGVQMTGITELYG